MEREQVVTSPIPLQDEAHSTSAQFREAGVRPRILHLSRNYPNSQLPRLGLWVQRLVQSCSDSVEAKVIAPVPYFPPLPGFLAYTRFRRIDRHTWSDGTEVFHPRFFVGPGYWLHSTEGLTYYLGVNRLVRRLRQSFPFDLIHAHFAFPDGWVAAQLGRRLRVPVIITEQAFWSPWMERYPQVRRRALWAANQSVFVVAISRALRDSISSFTGDPAKLRVIPNVVDGSVFTPSRNASEPQSNRILFVGIMRLVKGVDVLLKAMRVLVDRNPNLRLVIVGESFYEGYRRDHELFKRLVTDLGLEGAVEFLGGKSPQGVAAEMRKSSLLVLPSRRESFGSVLAEALACGIPVVATRCGGPEDVVIDQVGVLVPPENPEALASGIEEVLAKRTSYDPSKLRAYALEHFGREAIGRRLVALYQEALGRHRTAA